MRNFLRSDDTTTDDETQSDENEETSMSRDTTTPDSDEQPAYTGTQPVYTGVVYENESDAEATADPDTDVIDDQPHPTFTPASTESGYGTDSSSYGTDSSYGTNSSYGEPSATAVSDPAKEDEGFTRPVSAVEPAEDEPVAAVPGDESAMTLPEDRSVADEPMTGLPADEPMTAVPADEPMTAVPADEPVAAVPADQPVAASAPVSKPVAVSTADEPLLANTELMRASWQQVQAGFVDDPKAAVSDAADLIDNTVQTLVDTLQQRQRQLRAMLNSDSATGATNSNGFDSAPSDVPDTEQLRLMMHRYRSLFNQLVRS
jgi:hypothetical protein